MINLKKLFHFHQWETIQQGDYDLLGISSKSTIRRCKKCEIKQVLIVDCMGLNPAEYYSFWSTLIEPPECFNCNPNLQMQAENVCNLCAYRSECIK
ncbi:MAG: hypothetical protein RL755_44 [Pseudomonadota bacterium]|jgi:hypothetical protein